MEGLIIQIKYLSVISYWYSFEAFAAKIHLEKIFVIVMPKEGFAGPHQSFFWYDTEHRFVICSLHRSALWLGLIIVSVINKEGLRGLAWQSFFGTDMTNIL